MAEIGMGKGAGVGSFAAGFGRGLSKALLMNRERSDQKAREDREANYRYLSMVLPTVMQNYDPDHPEYLEGFFRQHMPEFFQEEQGKGKKAAQQGGGQFQHLTDILGRFVGLHRQKGAVIESGWPGGPVTMSPGGHVGMDSPEQGGITGMLGRSPGPFGTPPQALPPSHQPLGVSGGTLDNPPVYAPVDIPPDISQTPYGGAVQPPQAITPQSRMLLGVPQISRDEQAIRGFNAQLAVARRMVDVGAAKNLSDALDKLGLRSLTTPGGASSMRYGGILKGDQAGPDTSDVYGRPLDPNTYYRVQIQPTGDMSYTPTVAPGGNLGVDREAISRAMFNGKSFAQLDSSQQQRVMDAEKTRAGQMAESRSLGTERGQFEAPIDIKTAQETNLPVGTTAAQVAGQTVQTTTDRERIQSLSVLKTDLTRVQDLLAVLPSEKSLAGMAPGAVLAARRRMNSASGIKDADGKEMSYRSALAQLQANVDQMVNVLARVRGEQRGAQTERDAERAYNAVVQLQAGLLDPFGGDTQESAKARIQEALAGLERVIQQMPTQAVPPRPGAPNVTPAPRTAAPSAGPPGITQKDGILYGPDGKKLPGQR